MMNTSHLRISDCRINRTMLVFLLVSLLHIMQLTAADATINLDTANLSFAGQVNGSNPSAQAVTVSNTGPGGSTLNWSASATKPWFTVAPFGGSLTPGSEALNIQAILTQSEGWTGTTTGTGAPTARYYPTAVWTGREVIVWGGHDGSSVLNTGARYNPAADTWSAMSTTSAPSARHIHVAVWDGKQMIVWGGFDGSGACNTGGMYDPVTDTWTGSTTTTNAPTVRGYLSGVWTGAEMVVWGGYDGTNFLNDGARYNPATDAWTAVTATGAPAARALHSTIWTGDRIIVWGGEDNVGTPLNTGAIYNPATDAWTGTTSTTGATARYAHSGVWDGAHMIVWGGTSGSYLNTGALYDPATDTWTATTTTTSAPAARLAHAGAWTGKEMIVWGGWDGASYHSDGARYRPAIQLAVGTYNDTITVTDPLATNNPQTIAVSFTVSQPQIQVGATALNFIGYAGEATAAAQSVTIANPPAGTTLNWTAAGVQTWNAAAPFGATITTGTSILTVQPKVTQAESWPGSTTTTGAPSGRYQHVAVWTGREMVVWGGHNGTTQVNTGYRYDPVADAWSAISTTNAPAARQKALAVWTGSEMIVWGGYGSSAYSDGGRYDPVTDSWKSVTSSGAPGARSGSAAVWDGTQMIVWGGLIEGVGLTNTGALYNPATDTWTGTISTTGALGARQNCSAVWDGSHMIVWGGSDSLNNPLGDGAYYDPGADSWTGISGASAPVSRYGHSAAWTGTEMIVWGGFDSIGGYTNSGGRYNPATDTWIAATTTIGATTARYHHSAVWTGQAMIVWGGYDGSYQGTGKLYHLPISLSVGTYNDTITVSDPLASNNPRTIAVTLNVVQRATLDVATTTMNFSGTYGQGAPAAQTADVTNTGPSGSTLRWSATGAKPWFQVSPYGGTVTTGTDVATVTPVPTQAESWSGTSTLTGLQYFNFGFTGVWTGSRLIIWGGAGGSYQNIGSIYDPATDSWSNTSTLNAPAARGYTSAVWTGKSMIVWGGSAAGPVYGDGAKYDPVADVWTPISSVGAPNARNDHTAVWTGSKMIVWGGFTGGNQTNTGGIYDPATDSWTSTTTTNAPAGRYYHTAVWTGSKMIVWGGISTNGNKVNTGGLYDPATDTWTAATTTTGAPVGRYSAAAVWDGDEMIVYGGVNASFTVLNDGARYNPATDTWTGATTTTGAPAAASNAIAVWTGSSMLVWGGTAGVNRAKYYKPPINLPPGVYNDTIVVSDPAANSNPQMITVSLTLIEPAPTIALTATNVNITALEDDSQSAAQTSTLSTSVAGSTLNWIAQPNQPWLTVSPTSGSLSTGSTDLNIQATVNQAEAWTGSTTTTGAPSARHGHLAVWTGKEMIVWGGNDTFSDVNTGGRYNPATNTWSTMSTTNAPVARNSASAVWDGSEMIVWGGNSGGYVSTGGRYDPVNDSWTAMTTTNAPAARGSHAAVWNGTKMIVWGGWDGGSALDTGGLYDPATDTWTGATSTTGAASARYDFTGVWDGSRMIVWGGVDGGGFTNTGAFYNPATDTWTGTTTITNAPTARSGHTAVWDGAEMIVWGGHDGAFINTGAAYNPTIDTWTAATSTTGAASARKYHTAVWTGSQMIVWGGRYITTDYNNGALYQPPIDLAPGSYSGTVTVTDPKATNNPQPISVSLTVLARPVIQLTPTALNFTTPPGGANPSAQNVTLTNGGPNGTAVNWTAAGTKPWLTVSPWSGSVTTGSDLVSVQPILSQTESWAAGPTLTGAPVARYGHTMVWTGKEMLVWGGRDNTYAYLNSGGRYNPATDSWTAMSTTGAPSPRQQPVAVWDGSEMVVWSGYDNSSLATGARYNPMTDSWRPMSSSGAPEGRYAAGAVWTGSRMIIWGGASSTYLNTGGMYDPGTDTWSAGPTTTNAPAGRMGISAVWTGAEMIVWGGYNGTSFLNTGGRYNPATDTWTTAPTTTGAPTARYDHCAVWTGEEMVVWGGVDTDNANTGGRYNPATDTWIAATSLTGAPTAREYPAAIWDGKDMIVWGGWAGGTTATGGFYQPPFTLGNGVYEDTITVRDPRTANNPQTIVVTFTVNALPVIDSPADAAPNPVTTGFTTTVSVYASDADSYPSALTYTWSKVSGPGTVNFSPNGTTGASSATASFSFPGVYTLKVDVSDGAATVSSTVDVTVTTQILIFVDSVNLTLVGPKKDLQGVATIHNGAGNPVAGLSITCNLFKDGVYWASRSGTTAGDGTFTFVQTNAAAGTLTARVSALSGTGYSWNGVSPVGSVVKTAVPAIAQSVALQLVGTNQDLKGTATIQDGSGNPLSGLAITCNVFQNGAYWVSRSGVTAADGTFTFTQLGAPSATLTARVSALSGVGFSWNGISPWGTVEKTAVAATVQSIGMQLVGVNEDLQVTPTIWDPSNNPMAGLTVTCNIFNNGVYLSSRTGVTNASGQVTLTHPAPAPGTLTARVTAITGTNITWNHSTPIGSIVKTGNIAVVQSIGMALVGGNQDLQATPTIWDGSNNPVAGLTVTCNLFHNGVYISSRTGVTNASGQVALIHPNPASGTLTARVIAITGAGYTWNGVTPVGSIVK